MVKLTFPLVGILSVVLSIGEANPAQHQQQIVIEQDEGSGSMELSSFQNEGK